MEEKARILVAANKLMDLSHLKDVLSSDGYNVSVIADGNEVLEVLVREPFDLALLDATVQGIDVLEVTKRIRADQRTRLLPIVVITALTNAQDRIKVIEAGSDDCITRPFDIAELQAKIKTILKLNYHRSLLNEKEELDYILTHIDEGIAICDTNLKVVRSNEQADNFLSLETAQANILIHLQKSFKIHYTGKNLSRDILKRPLYFEMERPETESARPLILSARTSVIYDPLGKAISIVFIVTDVTEVRSEAFRKGTFLNLISHKLRTPLAAIIQSVGVLQEGALGSLNEKQQKIVEICINRSAEFKELIDKLLGLAAVNNQKPGLPKNRIDLKNWLPLIVNQMIRGFKGKEVSCSVSCEEDKAIIEISPTYLELILSNLIENSVKFNKEKKVEIKIDIRVKKEEDKIQIMVADNGEGIPPEYQARIFDKFYQIEKYDTGSTKGGGLGLAIVSSLMANHGGSVGVKSEVGHGSLFKLTFPIFRGL